MSYFIRNGNTFRVADERSIDIQDKLPVGNYIIKADQFGNLFLEMIDSFEHKGKVYGNTFKTVNRILNTFEQRPNATGVMLNGEKGSGKTLTAKLTSVEAAARGIPTIVINSAWCGDAFNKLIQDINQPCVILFDEFEKVYDSEQQESILTLLDGVFPSKKLFILTCNDKWRVDQHMRNRPGRIFYMLDYKGLDANFIVEYCNDTLNDKKYIETICKIATLFSEFNFDMLKALIEEMNRYDESPQEALAMLNAKPEFGNEVMYDVQAIVDNKPVDEDHFSPTRWKGNPLSRGIEVDIYNRSEDDDDSDSGWRSVQFSQSDLATVDSNEGKFIFSNSKGTVILTRQKAKVYDYYGAF